MQAACANCRREFPITEEDLKFYENLKVPPPTWCPQCRLMRRMAWRNERTLYKRACDLCAKSIISIYPAGNRSPVYCQECWWGDSWDPLSFGREYDFKRSFFQQFKELLDQVPAMNLFNTSATNSDYCNYMSGAKNSYLVLGGKENENTLYANRVYFCRDSMDLYTGTKLELCYENIQCSNSYGLSFSKYCDSCSSSAFLYDCKNCLHCFGCANLRGKQYYIFNQPHTKEEYFRKMKEFDLGSFAGLNKVKEEYRKIYTGAIHKYAQILKSQDSTGDNIQNCRNCEECFDLAGSNYENSKFSHYTAIGLKDSYDVYGLSRGERIYESLSLGFESNENANYFFSQFVKGSNEIYYSLNCSSSNFLFGCVGLRGKSYCILNKEYPKEEYHRLVTEIKAQMDRLPYTDRIGRIYKFGEFPPSELSPFAYNETIAQEYFPLTSQEAEKNGYAWREPENKDHRPDIRAENLPDHIKDAEDSILQKVIGCAHRGGCTEQCLGAFRIVPQELQFYRQMHLALPRLCSNCRHGARLKERGPFRLWDRKCMCDGGPGNIARHDHGHLSCPNTFQTPFPPDRSEKVYCEACYNAEVV